MVDALDALGARYRVGGSIASSALGVPRSTLDVDVVRRQSRCNLIHLATMLEVDLFVRRARPFEDAAFERRVRLPPTLGGRAGIADLLTRALAEAG